MTDCLPAKMADQPHDAELEHSRARSHTHSQQADCSETGFWRRFYDTPEPFSPQIILLRLNTVMIKESKASHRDVKCALRRKSEAVMALGVCSSAYTRGRAGKWRAVCHGCPASYEERRTHGCWDGRWLLWTFIYCDCMRPAITSVIKLSAWLALEMKVISLTPDKSCCSRTNMRISEQ